jgi:hypothetical protein
MGEQFFKEVRGQHTLANEMKPRGKRRGGPVSQPKQQTQQTRLSSPKATEAMLRTGFHQNYFHQFHKRETAPRWGNGTNHDGPWIRTFPTQSVEATGKAARKVRFHHPRHKFANKQVSMLVFSRPSRRTATDQESSALNPPQFKRAIAIQNGPWATPSRKRAGATVTAASAVCCHNPNLRNKKVCLSPSFGKAWTLTRIYQHSIPYSKPGMR